MSHFNTSVPLSRTSAQSIQIDVIPGLRQRIQEELNRLNVAEAQQPQYLSAITGRAVQTVSRWISPDKPGLPDLRSLAILCLQFGVDANWMLGLAQHRVQLPMENLASGLKHYFGRGSIEFDWIGALIKQARLDAAGCSVVRMNGDDMSPLIGDGAAVFFDPRQSEVSTNGVYLLEYEGKMLVRRVEIQIGDGLVIRKRPAGPPFSGIYFPVI